MGRSQSTKSQKSVSQAPSCPLPDPMGEQEWSAVTQQLSLAPQQERIVRLIMQSRSDKEIASDLGLALPTVRTYLERVYRHTCVDSRVKLIHRVYAIAIAAWMQGNGAES